MLCKTVLVGVLSVTAILCAFAQAPAVSSPRAEFKNATVNPGSRGTSGGSVGVAQGRFTAQNRTFKDLVRLAYRIDPFSLEGGPAWTDLDRYDVSAEVANRATLAQMLPMLRSLLEDRFKLKIHREMKESEVCVLTPAEDGVKLRELPEGSCMERGAKPSASPAQPPVFCGAGGKRGLKSADYPATSMEVLINVLESFTGRIVIDQTGFKGRFDLHLDWNSVPLSVAVEEQLGLKLESQKRPVEVFVIDHAEKPSEN